MGLISSLGTAAFGFGQGMAEGNVQNINDEIQIAKAQALLDMKAAGEESAKAKDRDRIAGVMKSVPTTVPGTMDKDVVETDDNYGKSVQRVPDKKRPFDDVLKDQTTALLNSGDTSSATAAAGIYGRENEAKTNLKQAALDTRLTIAEGKLDTATEIAKAKGDVALKLGGMRQEVKNNPVLTSTQKLKNMEIDAARKRIEGLSQDDIKKRTQKFTDSGRENKDYDPQLERRVRIASLRKMGDDPYFDSIFGGQDESPATGNADSSGTVVERFTSDPAMKGMRPGRSGPNGVEVFDSSGKLIGHYQ
ncbi:MAG: hypothetical protein IPO13_14955 [Rhodocyclaceae bacterium]|nr:hypothetical protein [Rhodocyclaceae bacterium]